jgi:trehalose 6-phosphate phosphatase
MKRRKADFDWDRFFQEVARTRHRALLLDYDGTLAPFRVERDGAIPNPRLRVAVEGIVRTGRTRVVVISGRALSDLIPLLAVEPPPELWGCHGWERRLPDGEYHGPQLAPPVRDALEQADGRARSAGLDRRCERKPASIAVHWRGLDQQPAQKIREHAQAAWEGLTTQAGLELREFDGGLELRASGRDKAYAVACVLRELEDDAIVAYAGDDQTDEDAFDALSGRGLSILARPEYRETRADLWLQSPDEWARFLEAWLAVDTEGDQT